MLKYFCRCFIKEPPSPPPPPHFFTLPILNLPPLSELIDIIMEDVPSPRDKNSPNSVI
jgi:hypothetical protein